MLDGRGLGQREGRGGEQCGGRGSAGVNSARAEGGENRGLGYNRRAMRIKNLWVIKYWHYNLHSLVILPNVAPTNH